VVVSRRALVPDSRRSDYNLIAQPKTIRRKIRADVKCGKLPRGAMLVIFFEFCERFGFYSMLSLLALFLTANRAGGGFGWSESAALRLLGIYTGLMYAMPMLGGLAADRLIGHRRAIAIGGTLMFSGYLMLASLGLVPLIFDAFAGGGVELGFTALKSPLGAWQAPIVASFSVSQAYIIVSFVFWLAIAVLVIGNALVKATLVIVLGDSFQGDDQGREAAYAYYYMGINLGGLIAGIIAGSIAVNVGWGAAFAAAAVGIGLGLTAYFALGPSFLGPVVLNRREFPGTLDNAKSELIDGNQGKRLALLTIFATLLFFFSVGSLQLWGTVSLFIERGIDRHVGGILIPTEWLSSIYSAALILSAPLFAAAWIRLGKLNREPDIITKYALALTLGAAGLLLFSWMAWPRTDGAMHGWMIPTFAITSQAAGEVAAWTATYGIIYRLAPRRIVAAVMGAFYATTLGLGGYIAAWIGQFSNSLSTHIYFLLLGVMTLAVAGVVLLLRGRLRHIAVVCGTDLMG